MPFRKFGDAHEASLYRNLVKELPNYAIFRISPKGVIESWNIGVERLLGYTEPEFIGLPFEALFTEEDRQRDVAEQELETASTEGRSLDEGWHQRKDGNVFFADGMVTPILDEHGELAGFTKVMRDATDRKLADESKERLVAQVSELAHALDLTHTIVRELDGSILIWTQGAEFLYGWSPEEAKGRCSHDLLQTEFSEPLETINRRLLELGEWQGELTHTTKNGKRITVASHWVVHWRAGDEAVRVIEVNNDISDVKAIQGALEEANAKFERANAELASFAYEVAHDIKSPLRGIGSFAEMLSKHLGSGSLETQRKLLDNVLRSTDKLKQLIDSLLQYATVENDPEGAQAVPFEEILKRVRDDLTAMIEETGTTPNLG